MQPLRAGLGHHGLDVDLAQLVGARHHPDPVGCRRTVELSHEVEAVAALVPGRAVPMGSAVLVPGNRRPQARLLEEQGLRERHEIVAVDGGGNRQQLRVAIGAQTGLGELQ